MALVRVCEGSDLSWMGSESLLRPEIDGMVSSVGLSAVKRFLTDLSESWGLLNYGHAMTCQSQGSGSRKTA